MPGDRDRDPPDDSPLLHPGNEGHDAERQRDRLEKWAAEEGGDGPDAIALQEELDRARAAGVPLAQALPREPVTPPPPRGELPDETAEALRYRHEDHAPPYGKKSREK